MYVCVHAYMLVCCGYLQVNEFKMAKVLLRIDVIDFDLLMYRKQKDNNIF